MGGSGSDSQPLTNRLHVEHANNALGQGQTWGYRGDLGTERGARNEAGVMDP